VAPAGRRGGSRAEDHVSWSTLMRRLRALFRRPAVEREMAEERRREVGIRLALGAPVPSVVRALLRATLGGAAVGVAVGLPATLATTRLLSSFLFGVSPHDLTIFVASVAGLLVVAAVAGWLPARRAGRLDVTTVLRTE
jgi:putative ABC transport system permease protein